MAKVLTSKEKDYAKWYNDLVTKADLAENSPVRGCMVIKPYGYAIWESMQADLDRRFKETGHENVYFPLFIPKSFLSKEADHVEGFAKECAVVTHYRLKSSPDGGVEVDPEAKLEDELIVRPTSETVIWDTYKKWIQSYRDLPLLYNQWANVVRWEMRTRLFLRTSEFLWQEGHTAHATKQEAILEAEQMLRVYAEFVEDVLAIPVIRGLKSESERFAGALETYCIEAMMQDGKALQAGTSHFLGQNFAKAFDVKFLNKEGVHEHVWATSWGVSTRLMGALIMSHSDDYGLVLPPKVAPYQVVIVPIYRKEGERELTVNTSHEIAKKLRAVGVRVKVDDRDTHKPGFKFNQYELQGCPLRIAVGPRDLEKEQIELARRDTLTKECLPIEGLESVIENLLEEVQTSLYQKSLSRLQDNTVDVTNYDQLKEVIKQGQFARANWDGDKASEDRLQKETKATIRCIPMVGGEPDGACAITGNTGKYKVIIAKAY